MTEPLIFDTSAGQQLRINTIGSWLRRRFGCKVVKLSLDGGFTCPNRDGTKGTGGCLFCSQAGSGEHASVLAEAGELGGVPAGPGQLNDPSRAIRAAVESQIRLLAPKWPRASYIAYFQNNTNTYGPVQKLRLLFESAIRTPGIVGLAIATRPDCLDEKALDLLEELNQKTFLWVELGLQTIHEETARAMNLCYSLQDYEQALSSLQRRGIPVVTHLILGLPGESREMMLRSVEYAGRDPFGIKLHMLNLVRDSGLYRTHPHYIPFDTMEDYVELVIDCLERIPPQVTLHRIYAEAPAETLVAPAWARQKRKVLNRIAQRMKERNTWQGRLTDQNTAWE